MEILKIILQVGEQTLLGDTTKVVFDSLNSKKINTFLMPNGAGKSLIFNALEHLLSANTEGKYIKDTNKDLEVQIYFKLNKESYIYTSTYARNFHITKDGEEVGNFEEILEEYLGIKEEKLECYGSTKNSLFSLNRFNFLDFSTIFDKEDTNEISFIDSRYDGISKKFILAYILGAKIDGGFFKKITEYEYKKDFINKHQKKFEKHLSRLSQISLLGNVLQSLFVDLEDSRIVYGDLTIALKEITLLKEEYVNTFGDKSEDEDLLFLKSQIQQLEGDKVDLGRRISELREKIKGEEFLEEKALIGGKTFKRAEIEKFEMYIEFKEDLKKFDDMKISKYIAENIDPFISKYKYFLDELYNIFVKKSIEKKLIKEDIIEEGSIIFKEKTLTIEALFKTSEGMRKAIRIMTFIGLHIFSNKEKTRCLDYSFYDSFIENIDYDFRDILFESVFEFIELKSLEIPKIFFFVTKVEKSSDNSIYNIVEKYKDNMNLIDEIGLK